MGDIGRQQQGPKERKKRAGPTQNNVTRSRRKLFTPRAEPLDESEDSAQPALSGERLRVPRPSYHRAARRKL